MDKLEEKIRRIAECKKETCEDCTFCSYYYAITRFCEDSAVLSKEELEDLKTAKDFNYGYHSGESNMISYYENIRLPEVCKETAGKFAELKTVWEQRAKEYTDWAGNKVKAVTLDWLFADIDETCKEITEGKS